MKRLYVIFACAFMVVWANCQTMKWAVRPTSTLIENYGDLLKVTKSGKCGLVDMNNQEVVPMEYDSISPFRDGFAIVMNKVGNELKIEGVISDGDYELMPVSETIYATRYMYFSEGKMPVKGDKGWGYLDTDGNIVIPCLFQMAYPFSEGFASVKIDNKAYYVNRNMEYMPIEVGYGSLVFGSTFSGNEAVVFSGYSLTPKGYVINRKGRVIRKLKEKISDVKVNSLDHSVGNKAQIYEGQVKQLDEDTRYSVFQENGLYGYRKDGMIVLPAQLDKAEPVRGEYANVMYKGMSGVLHVIEGSFSVELENGQIDVVGKQVDKGFLKINIPEEMVDAPVRLRMFDGNYKEMPVQSLSTQGESRSFSFLPSQTPHKSETINYTMELWSENLLLWKGNGSVNYIVSKPVVVGETVKVTPNKPTGTVSTAGSGATSKVRIASFTISSPKAQGKRADPFNTFNVTVNVSNSGDQTGKANVSLIVDEKKVGSESKNVKGRSSTNFKFAAVTNVKKERYAKVRAILSNGTSSEVVNIHVLPQN